MSIAARALGGRSSAASRRSKQQQQQQLLISAKTVICSQRQAAAANAEQQLHSSYLLWWWCCLSLSLMYLPSRQPQKKHECVYRDLLSAAKAHSCRRAAALLSCNKSYPQSAKLLLRICAAQEQQLQKCQAFGGQSSEAAAAALSDTGRLQGGGFAELSRRTD